MNRDGATVTALRLVYKSTPVSVFLIWTEMVQLRRCKSLTPQDVVSVFLIWTEMVQLLARSSPACLVVVSVFLIWTEMVQPSPFNPCRHHRQCFSVLDMNRDGATIRWMSRKQAINVSVFLIWTEMVQRPRRIVQLPSTGSFSVLDMNRDGATKFALLFGGMPYSFQCSWYEPRWCNGFVNAQYSHHHCFSVLDMNRDGATTSIDASYPCADSVSVFLIWTEMVQRARRGGIGTLSMFQCSWYEPRWCNAFSSAHETSSKSFQCSWYEPRWCNNRRCAGERPRLCVSVFLIWTEMVQHGCACGDGAGCHRFSVLDMNRDGATILWGSVVMKVPTFQCSWYEPRWCNV